MRNTSKVSSKRLATIGNSLMALSVVVALVIFYPLIKEELLYRTTNMYSTIPSSEEFSIMIPSIKINMSVQKNIDPWNKNEYLKALENGIAHAKDSSLPNQNGTVYLFSHSFDFPWRITKYNVPFYRLGRVNLNDQITLTFEGNEYLYKVREKKVVWPSEVEYLTQLENDQLILQTCSPIGTSLKRLLVFADPVEAREI